MIKNQKIELINKNEIKFEWEWTGLDGYLNVYIQKFQDDKLEKVDSIIQMGGLAYGNRLYKIDKKGLYKIVVFPVRDDMNDKKAKIDTDYICIGGKNILEYSFEDVDDMSCSCINIKRLDIPISKNLAYLESISDGTKIPFTADLRAGQKFYIASYGDLKIEIKYPYSLEVEKRRV